MKQFIEKLIGRLEKERIKYFATIANTGNEKYDCAYAYVGKVIDDAIAIAKKTSEEYFGELQDEVYNKGLEDGRNEVWELASKIQGLDCKIREKIYGIYKMPMIFEKFTPQEALAKLEAYEKEQAEIKVGDVVKPEKGVEFVVTYISSDSHLFGITFTGDTYSALPMKYCTKTGKHIDIKGVLRQIGGDVNGNS